jgi:hypothetical protein
MPLKGYGDATGIGNIKLEAEDDGNSALPTFGAFLGGCLSVAGIVSGANLFSEDKKGLGAAAVIAGVLTGIATGIYSWLQPSSELLKARDRENIWVNEAWKFRCDNTQLSPGQAFAKYQGYLSVIASFLTKYSPKDKNFRSDLKSVFEMSQDDSRLTSKEKQEIVDKFAGNYKFLLHKKQTV